MKLKQYNIRIRLFNENPYFGKGVYQLMYYCDQFGSLSKAYKHMGMSNSKAWKILKRAEEDLGFTLIETTSGGARGGSSYVTKEGKALMEKYVAFNEKIDQYANTLFKEMFDE